MSKLLHLNDGPIGSLPSSYYAASQNKLKNSELLTSKLTGTVRADVAIIGAGFTGLSAALNLAQKGYTVALLEAHRVGWGASGRNGGQLAVGQRVDQEDLEDWVGKTHARALWDIGLASNRYVKDLVQTLKIDCDLKHGLLYADHKSKFTVESQKHAAFMQKNYDYDGYVFLNAEETSNKLGTAAYFSSLFIEEGGHLHPLNFALGLADAALAAGVSIYEETEVLNVSSNKVSAQDGCVEADHLVFACNGYLGDLNKQVAAHVMPINNFILTTEPLGQRLANEIIRGEFAVADSRFVVNYYRKTPDGRLLFGGGETYKYKFPSDIAGLVRKRMLAIYPQLKDLKIDYSWGGTLAITMNRMPFIRRLNATQWNASGYSGSGVAMATFCGKMVADAIDADLSAFDPMCDVPAFRFPGGAALRTPLLMTAMTWYALRDRLG